MNIADETHMVFMTLLAIATIAFFLGLAWPRLSKRISHVVSKREQPRQNSELLLIITSSATTTTDAAEVAPLNRDLATSTRLSERPGIANSAMVCLGAVALAAVMTVSPSTPNSRTADRSSSAQR